MMNKATIKQLEAESLKLTPNLKNRNKLEHLATDYAQRYYESLQDSKAYQKIHPEIDNLLEDSIPEEGMDKENVIRKVEEEIVPPGLNLGSGRHFGYIPGGGLHSAAVGDYLAAVTNRYASVYTSSPGAALLETRMVNWLCSEIGYGAGSGGFLASGGSIANLTAVVVARDQSGVPSESYKNLAVYFSSQTHHCVDRALHIAGLDDCKKRRIPLDEKYRMKPGALEKAIIEDRNNGLIPWMVVASAGSTDTGAVDPLNDIAQICENQRLWYHVDAAYGGFFILTDKGKEKLKGIERSDSAVLDPHKGMFLPYGTGALLVKDVEKLAASHQYSAGYMRDSRADTGFYSPADISPELSKHFRAMRMWLPLQIHGLKPFRAALKEKLLLARYLWEELSKLTYIEVSPVPQLSIFMFRWLPAIGDINEQNKKLHKRLLDAGHVFMSTTEIEGNVFFRIAVLSARTHLKEADDLLREIKEKIDELERGVNR